VQRLIVFSHLIGIATYLGATVLLVLVIESFTGRRLDAVERREGYATVFRAYNPLAIGALGVVVMTGAWSITPYKEALGGVYFQQVGSALAGKLSLAFLLIIMGTWVSFGICHRLVRAAQGALPVTDAELDRVRARLRVAAWLTVAFTLLTVWVSLGIEQPRLPAGQ